MAPSGSSIEHVEHLQSGSTCLIIVVGRLTMIVCQHGVTPGPEKVQAALSGIQCLLAVRSMIGRNYVTR